MRSLLHLALITLVPFLAASRAQGQAAPARSGVPPPSAWECPLTQPIKGNFTTYSGDDPRRREGGHNLGRRTRASDAWKIDEFLTYFETVWSLWRTNLVDKEMVYDLLSDDLISTYEANDRESERIIRKRRTVAQDAGDMFIGVENLYHVMKRMTATKNPPRIR